MYAAGGHQMSHINGDISATAYAINLFEPPFSLACKALLKTKNSGSNKLIA